MREKYKGLSRFNLSVEDIKLFGEPIRYGTTSAIYLIRINGKKVIIKMGSDIDSELNARREYTFLRLLSMRGGEKKSPSPYYLDQKRDLIVMEFIEGDTLADLSSNEIIGIAKTLSSIHAPEFTRPGMPFCRRRLATQYDRLLEQIDFLERWFARTRYLIEQETFFQAEGVYKKLSHAKTIVVKKAKRMKKYFQVSSFSLIHYDLNPNNILIDATGQIIFLDWRQASIGDRAMDIAKFFYKNYLDERQRELFFRIYIDAIKDPTIIFRTATYYPLIVLSSLLWRIRFLNIDIKEHPNIENQASTELIRDRLKDDYEYLMSITRL